MRLPHAVQAMATAAAVVLSLLTVAGCGSGSLPAAPQTPSGSGPRPSPEIAKIVLIMDWTPWVLDIPIDVAQEKGFYAQAGLQVAQTLPAAATDVVKFVAMGKAQLGLYYAPDMLMGADEGAALVSVAGLMTHAPVGLALRPGVTGTDPRVLTGSTIAVPMVPSTRASVAAMVNTAGLSDVKVADPGYSLVAPLLSGKYEAVAVTKFGELVEARRDGHDIGYIDFRDWGTPDYAFLNVITSAEFARTAPNTVRGFVAATLRGLEYAAAHVHEAAAIYAERHPELDRELLEAQWRAALPFMATAGTRTAGWQNRHAWEKLAAWMHEAGLLKQPADVHSAMTNSFLPR